MSLKLLRHLFHPCSYIYNILYIAAFIGGVIFICLKSVNIYQSPAKVHLLYILVELFLSAHKLLLQRACNQRENQDY